MKRFRSYLWFACHCRVSPILFLCGSCMSGVPAVTVSSGMSRSGLRRLELSCRNETATWQNKCFPLCELYWLSKKGKHCTGKHTQPCVSTNTWLMRTQRYIFLSWQNPQMTAITVKTRRNILRQQFSTRYEFLIAFTLNLKFESHYREITKWCTERVFEL